MKNRYHFICWVCCMLVGITVTRSQEFQQIPSVPPVLHTLQAATNAANFVAHDIKNTEENTAKFFQAASLEFNAPIGTNFIVSSQTICANTTPAGLSGSAPSGGNGPGTYLYQWQNSTTSSSTGFSDIPTATLRDYSPGIIAVTTWYRRVVVSGAESDTSASIEITAKPATINLVINKPAVVCAPQTVDITAPAITAGSTPGLTFIYYTSSNMSTVATNANAISSSLGLNTDYYIKATNGCDIKSGPVRVVINKQPTISPVAPTIPVCKYGMTPLTAISMGNNVSWQNISTPVPNVSSVMVYPAAQTTYNAIATIPSTGCTRVVPVTVQVRDFSMSLAASPDPVIAGNPVTLTPSSVTNFTVNGWLPENLFASQTAPTQSFTISDTSRTFSVIGRSEDGCLDTASVKVSIDVNTTDIFVPNAFTPNNDGRNDIFKVYGSSVKNIEMKIFDQWGRSVHETNNNATGWDGSHQGKPQPVGVYMYVIKIRLDNEDSFIRKGTVNLIR